MGKASVGEAMMPWTGHLAEMRARIIRSVLVIALGTIGGWYLSPTVLAWLSRPVGRLVFVAPAEAFMAYMQIAFALGILLASPWVLWEAWLFVRPGMLENEHRFMRRVVPFIYLLLLAGGAVGYQLLFPIGVKALLQLASGPVTPAVSVAKYLGVFWSTVFPCALAFELPLLVVVAAALGMVDLHWLRTQRAMALLLSFVIGGIISSQGVLVQILLSLPLFALYEVGIMISSIMFRKHNLSEPSGS